MCVSTFYVCFCPSPSPPPQGEMVQKGVFAHSLENVWEVSGFGKGSSHYKTQFY